MSIASTISKKISPQLKAMGFSRKGNKFHYIQNDIAYGLLFEAPSGLLYVTVYFMPLYIPFECKYITYGERLNNIRSDKIPHMRNLDGDEAIDRFCMQLAEYVREEVLPYFNKIRDPRNLVRYLERTSRKQRKFIGCPLEHIERLKVHTYFYLGEIHKKTTLRKAYKKKIVRSNLIPEYQKKYMDELEMITNFTADEAQEYLNCTIEKMRSLF